MRQGQPDAAVGLFQVLEADRRELRAAERAGKADQQERAIAQAAEVPRDRRQQAAQDGGGGRDLLARQLALAGGVALDAGQRLGDADIVGGDRAAGGAVQIADRGAAQFQRFRRQFLRRAFAGEEGGDIGAGGGQGREVVAGAPGAHRGAVGAAGVLRLGHPGIGWAASRSAASVPSSTGASASTALSNQALTVDLPWRFRWEPLAVQ